MDDVCNGETGHLTIVQPWLQHLVMQDASGGLDQQIAHKEIAQIPQRHRAYVELGRAATSALREAFRSAPMASVGSRNVLPTNPGSHGFDPRLSRQRQLEEALFGLSDRSVIRGYAQGTAEVRPLISFLERELQKGLSVYYEPVLKYCGFPIGDLGAQSLVDLVTVVAKALWENEAKEFNMHMVLVIVRRKNNLPAWPDDPPKDPPPAVGQGIFSLFGCLTLLYRIPNPPSEKTVLISEPINPLVFYQRKSLDDLLTPIGDLVGSFGEFAPRYENQERKSLSNWPPKQKPSVDLSTSVVNAFVLKRIGKLKIVWSDLLSAHLMYDQHTRTLTVFRFPTFCALYYPRASQRTLFDCIFDDRVWTRPGISEANRSMFREALLTYRLLFGQDTRSRALFNGEERKRAGADGNMDLLLLRLCGQKDNISSLVMDASISEQAFYDSVVDFPFFGRRLEILERYARSRKPRGLADLWYDRRDPGQWALVWVFLIVGAIAIILSLVQIGLAAAQLRVAMRDL
ncbi:MAG: hypothetical protein Q9183_003458 [Haloplaca sp. 2 TL-2023]